MFEVRKCPALHSSTPFRVAIHTGMEIHFGQLAFLYNHRNWLIILYPGH